MLRGVGLVQSYPQLLPEQGQQTGEAADGGDDKSAN